MENKMWSVWPLHSFGDKQIACSKCGQPSNALYAPDWNAARHGGGVCPDCRDKVDAYTAPIEVSQPVVSEPPQSDKGAG